MCDPVDRRPIVYVMELFSRPGNIATLHTNIALGYSVSSSSMYPAIRYATRCESDTTGTLQNEASLMEGTAYQTGYNRWGDDSSINVDPTDDCTFWYTNEYVQNTALGWQTRIGSFQVQECQQRQQQLPFLAPLLLPEGE